MTLTSPLRCASFSRQRLTQAQRKAPGRWPATPGGLVLLAAIFCQGVPVLTQAAETAGKVVHARGAASVQDASGSLRFVGAGDPLVTGDVVSTGERSFAVLELGDQSRIVLRPSTRFALTAWNTKKGEERALFDLLTGGFRAVTGFLNKQRPGAVTVRSAAATIGIRGTDFAARVCEGDCGEDVPATGVAPGGVAPGGVVMEQSAVVARVILTAGAASRLTGEGPEEIRQPLIKGSPLYAGSVVETGKPGLAVIVFRDDTRVALGPGSRFAVERYLPPAAEAAPATAAAERPRPTGTGASADGATREPALWLRLVRGGLRAVTGGIAALQPTAFRVATPTATIGVRGTGFDLQYPGECGNGGNGGGDAPGEGLAAGVWEGSIELQESNATLASGESGCVFEEGGDVQPTRAGPKVEAPRPDEVEVPAGLFAAEARSGTERGLHVSVFDGQVVISSNAGEVTLGRGEDGLAGGMGLQPLRYEAFSPVARVDVFTTIDPIGAPADWNAIDPTAPGGVCAP